MPRAARLTPRHNLPAQPTALVGRHAELAKIAGLLANPGCRLLTLVGVGSVGKTRLALAAAAQHLDDFSAGCEMTLDACVALARGELAEDASD